MCLRTVQLNIDSNVVIGEFVVGLEEVTTEIGIKNLYAVAKGVDFPEFEVVVDFLGKLSIQFLELIFCG